MEVNNNTAHNNNIYGSFPPVTVPASGHPRDKSSPSGPEGGEFAKAVLSWG